MMPFSTLMSYVSHLTTTYVFLARVPRLAECAHRDEPRPTLLAFAFHLSLWLLARCLGLAFWFLLLTFDTVDDDARDDAVGFWFA